MARKACAPTGRAMIIYKKSSRPFLKTRFAHISDQRSSGWSEVRVPYQGTAYAGMIKISSGTFDGPSLPKYKSDRRTPYRGRPWRGWMLLCFFLRAEESKNMARLCLAKKGVWGYPPTGQSPEKKILMEYWINSESHQSAESTIYPILRKPNCSIYTPEQFPSFSGPSPYHYNAWKSPPTHPPAG